MQRSDLHPDRSHGKCGHLAHGRRRLLWGQIVHADVEKCRAVRHCPFDGEGAVARLVEHAQVEACIDIVVVGQGYQRLLTEDIFDLRFFQLPGVQRRERRSPPGPLQIHVAAFERAVFLLLFANRAG